MDCWNCGAHNKDGYKYCGNCGAENKFLCPNCKHPTNENLQFCGNCGYELEESIYFTIGEYKKFFGDPSENLSLLTNGFGGLKADKYIIVITEKTLNIPFKLSPEIIKKTYSVVNNEDPASTTDLGKAKTLFNFITKTIKYGETKRGSSGYRDAIEVFKQQEGVCGEMAILFVSMARIAGLIANYVSVKIDVHGKSVAHACAAVKTGSSHILVDLSYYTFDIQHKKYDILTDEEFTKVFRMWDG